MKMFDLCSKLLATVTFLEIHSLFCVHVYDVICAKFAVVDDDVVVFFW